MSSDAVHARPGRLTRSFVYQPYVPYDIDVAEGTAPIWLYLRLSKYHGDGADAIERQRIDLQRKLAREGRWTIVGEFVDNDSASASAVRTRRGWHQLNASIDSRAVTAVAFWKLDRTSRIAAEMIEWLGRCRTLGCHLVSHEDGAEELNSVSASAKIVTGIKALFAEIETDTMSVRQRAAKSHLAEGGFFHGGQEPFGWRSNGRKVSNERGVTGVRLVPHPVEHRALAIGAEMILAGSSLAEVAEYWASQLGIVTAKGSTIPVGNVRRYLTSPRMMGYRMRQVPEWVRGQQLNLLDYVVRDSKGDPIVSQEPVLSPEIWRKLVAALEARRTSPGHRAWGSNGQQWLLAGMLKCGSCAENLYGMVKLSVSASGERKSRRVYTCRTNARRLGLTCDRGVNITADGAERYVVGWLFGYLDPENLAAVRASNSGNGEIASTQINLEIADAKAELAELAKRRSDPSYRGAMIGILLDLMTEVSDRISTLEAKLIGSAPKSLQIQDVEERWPALSLSQRRSILSATIRPVVVRPGAGRPEDRLEVIPQ